jgi:hypothetical protein
MWLQQINAMKNTQNPFLNYYWINCVVVYNIMKLNYTALLLVRCQARTETLHELSKCQPRLYEKLL